jgi:phosphinothricin acetyltransferase
MHIRDAHEADLDGILQIYNHAVLHTTAIWNEKAVDLANRQAWLSQRNAQGYPVLVAVDDAGTVLGYASFCEWRAWDGYRHTVEHSVYVQPDHVNAGIGKALMRELIARARTLGKHVMVAGIESENRASIHMHQQLGFVHVGQLREVGTKFGRWLDLTFMQLVLNPQQSPS